jgi:hypothetical protein
MTNLFDKLNLRPQERRLVVGVGIVVFIVLNIWLVWPEVGSLGRWTNKKDYAEKTLRSYQDEIRREPAYSKQRADLKALGTELPRDGQVVLQREVEKQARLANVAVTSWSPERRGVTPGRTNFFEEESLVIRVLTGEKELIDFLYNVGAQDSSLIRVRSLSLQPDGARHRLAGDITLVQSFQKTSAAKRSGTPARPNTAASVPAATPAPTAVDNRPIPAGTTPPKTKSSPSPGSPGTPTAPPALRPVPINPTNVPNRVNIPKRQVPKSNPTD